jgi:hypothetical protein
MPEPMPPSTPPQLPPQEFKPNIYPIMYWALAFGAVAGVLLFLIGILDQFISLIWFPVFLAGLIWGGYRNYLKQKQAWRSNLGIVPTPGSPLSEFKEAIRDVTDASRELIAQEAPPEPEPAPYDEEPTSDSPPTPPTT